ncbi:FAD-dependent oxidoreductase [Candidatus Pelagibacter sp.]|nr:FAD-dependent oxidoreductase [Candidatus Pelagibacter sp.]MDB3960196.1 FAD-dependent oxidoreductase [Candidatus Pelagibacter sp.]MDB4613536.1 FAD-dependent oxidoreductase [Candidatus Pelagibacter sp.]MDB9765433.1 FAD-dependent oxidoreductase [Candidatus Pelagibacter sp.]MDC3274180.1 FAD-dependent oxidoreductase [Candidatus Pelagibacter sp.]
MKIAVIGSGISGLSSAYYLSKKHKVDLFEKQDRFGGHSYTLDIKLNEKEKVAVDAGFMVFNKITYPNLINFFKENDIEIEKSDMSFSVSVKGTNIEYCGKGLNGIFSNRGNLLNLKFVKMFFEIINFYKRCEKLNSNNIEKITLGEYLTKIGKSKYFIDYHIIPMVSAIWSMPPFEASQMPLTFFLSFFKNHGLFKLKDRPQWYTVTNRSKTYVDKILSKVSGEYFKNYEINKIIRDNNGVKVYYGSENEFFNYDKVVLASHADENLKIISDITNKEREILSNFKYKPNKAVIHSDENLMPVNKNAWCSWNSSLNPDNKEQSSVTYWLNQLQNLKTDKNIFLTINPFVEIASDKIYHKIDFTHPYYDEKALQNQSNLKTIQNKNNTLFAGSYFGYGFHEDGIKSSIEMLKTLND